MIELAGIEKGVVISYGEMLWDVFPDHKRPGGSPLNIAFHLSQQGISCYLVSKLGKDDLGRVLFDFLISKGISSRFVEWDDHHQTGEVQVSLGNGVPDYTIKESCAWDYIQPDVMVLDALRQNGVIIYGSLSSRSKMSAETLDIYLEVAKLRILDLNLRKPFIDTHRIETLLESADLLKVSEEELQFLTSNLERNTPLVDRMKSISIRYQIPEMVCTMGGEGAWYWSENEEIFQPAFQVKVLDTVGCGDAFLSGFIGARLLGVSNKTALRTAAARAAYVATSQGATPEISESNIQALLERQ